MQRSLRAVNCQRKTGIGESGVESNVLASQRPREYRLFRPVLKKQGVCPSIPVFGR